METYSSSHECSSESQKDCTAIALHLEKNLRNSPCPSRSFALQGTLTYPSAIAQSYSTRLTRKVGVRSTKLTLPSTDSIELEYWLF